MRLHKHVPAWLRDSDEEFTARIAGKLYEGQRLVKLLGNCCEDNAPLHAVRLCNQIIDIMLDVKVMQDDRALKMMMITAE